MDQVQTTPSPRDADSFKTPKPSRVRGLLQRGSEGGSPAAPLTPITIPASPFMQKLGCGTGVNVYLLNRVSKPNQSPWAVKKINGMGVANQRALFQQRLCEEAETLRDLKHPNIVGFRAFTTAKDGSKCLAMEFGGEQSLNDLIERRREEEGPVAFPAPVIEKVALHVARGLQYLHNEKRLLHGDIKSCNVVIKGDFDTVKICDVGVSLPLDENMRVSDPKADYVGTEPWSPKEALEGGEITDRADIFAYGLTLWEMMSLAMPHLEVLEKEEKEKEEEEEGEEEDEESEDEDFDEDAYYEKLGTRPPLDAARLGGAYQKIVSLFCLCTEEDPKKRPSAAQIVQALESNAPINPYFSDKSSEVIVID